MEGKPRTPEQVNNDYFHLATQLGDAVFRMNLAGLHIEELKKALHKLNDEMVTAKEFHGGQVEEKKS